MEYKTDGEGQEVLLNEGGHQVMMEWEKLYMEALIDALRPFGDVLEVGFGLGYSAARIQKHLPKSHTIIECDPVAIKKAQRWAAKRPSVRIVEDTWQNALPHLAVFDAIFFDDYPLGSGAPVEWMELESASSSSLVREGEDLLKKIEEQFHPSRISYGDRQLEAFCQNVPKSKRRFLFRFLGELEESGQISAGQYRSAVLKYKLEGTKKEPPPPVPRIPDRTMEFLRLCLKSHMRKGSRFSAFSGSPVSKYENPVFFEEVILNPNLEYREFEIPVQAARSCRYYKWKEALVMVIEKVV